MKGKFDSLKDQVVYRASLDGTAETLGDVEGFGHYSRVTDFHGSDYIVTEDSQGFVSVASFKAGQSWSVWSELEDAYDAWLTDGDAPPTNEGW